MYAMYTYFFIARSLIYIQCNSKCGNNPSVTTVIKFA